MSLKWFDGFESYVASELIGLYAAWSLGGTGDSISASTRLGGQSWQFRATSGGGQGNPFLVKSLPSPSSDDFVVGFAINIVSNSTASKPLIMLREGSISHLGLYVSVVTGGKASLILARGATGIHTIADALTQGVWHWVEMKGRIHDTTGYAIVRVDGVEVANVTGLDTRNAGTTGEWDQIVLGPFTGGDTNHNFLMDDVFLLACDATAPNDFIGEVREVRLLPTGAGAHTDFTPSAGSNFQNVDDTGTPDDDTTYNASGTPGDTDTFSHEDLPIDGGVLAVREFIRARKIDVGTRIVRQAFRIGATDYEGPNHVLAIGYKTFVNDSVVSPATGIAWTEAEIDAMEHGYTIQT